jgi:hypothetical protein
MDFDFTEEQRLLKESLDRLIADRYGFDQRQSYAQSPEAGAARCGGNWPSSAYWACRLPSSSAARTAARSRR